MNQTAIAISSERSGAVPGAKPAPVTGAERQDAVSGAPAHRRFSAYRRNSP